MKAIIIKKFGNIDVLEPSELNIPSLKRNSVLIKIKAIGLNPIDYKTRSGQGILQKESLPLILGWDVCGIITAIDDAVTDFSIGDEVMGMLAFPKAGNAYAEYAVASCADIIKKPPSLSSEQAAAIPLAALTAWQGLIEYGQLQPNDKVLIHAGLGGVGHLAIQIAKAHGAYVYTTASNADHPILINLKADQCIDYKNTKFEDIATNIDIVLDTIGGETLKRSITCLNKNTGRIISIRGRSDPKLAQELTKENFIFKDIIVKTSKDNLLNIANLINKHQLQPIIDKTFPLTEVNKAHAYLEAGHTKGKVVLTIP